MPDASVSDGLPPLREVINQYGLRADKKFGQNFILDLNLTRRIAREAGDLTNCDVIEVGPGPGAPARSEPDRGEGGGFSSCLPECEGEGLRCGRRWTSRHGPLLPAR